MARGRVLAGAFLVAALLLISYIAWDTSSEPEETDMAPLVRDLDEFTAPSGATASPAVAVACEDDGLSPHAERRFVVETSLDAVAADLTSQAEDLGWTRAEGGFLRNDRLLSIGAEETGDENGIIAEAVILTVSAPGGC